MSPLQIACPHCSATIKAPPATFGKILKCPKCRQRIQIPVPPPETAIILEPVMVPVATQHAVPPTSRRDQELDELQMELEDLREDQRRERRRAAGTSSNSLGIASLVLGCVALVVSLLPCAGVVSLPISSLGLLLGLIGFAVALGRGGSGIGFSIGGVALSIVALAIGLFWLGVFGATSTAVDLLAKDAQKRREAAQKTNQVVEQIADKTPTKIATKSLEWIDASKNGARQGDVLVRVLSATVDKVELDDLGKTMKSVDRHLVLRVSIANKSETKKVTYSGWGDTSSLGFDGDRRPRLVDNFGNEHQRVGWGVFMRPKGQVLIESIFPEKSIEDLLVFDRPIEKAEHLRLELPAKAFGGTGKLRFEIPRAMISMK